MSMTLTQVQDFVDDFLASYNGNIKLTPLVRETQEEIYGQQAKTDEVGKIQGSYHPSRFVFSVFSSNIRDEADLQQTLRHELLGHYGLNTFKPHQKHDLLVEILATRDEPTLAQAWAHVDKHYADQPEFVKAEELFCRIAEEETGFMQKAWDRFRATLQRTLRDAGLFGQADSPLTIHELRDEAQQIAKGIREGQRVQQNFPQDDLSLFSRRRPTVAPEGQGSLFDDDWLIPPVAVAPDMTPETVAQDDPAEPTFIKPSDVTFEEFEKVAKALQHIPETGNKSDENLHWAVRWPVSRSVDSDGFSELFTQARTPDAAIKNVHERSIENLLFDHDTARVLSKAAVSLVEFPLPKAEVLAEYPAMCERFAKLLQAHPELNAAVKSALGAHTRPPHELALNEFKAIADATALVRHGRRWEVSWQVAMPGQPATRDHGFSDAETEDGAIRDMHRALVNNAIFINAQTGQLWSLTSTMPPQSVLDEYPDLRIKFADFLGDDAAPNIPSEPRFALAVSLSKLLNSTGVITKLDLFSEADIAFGGTQAEGKYSSRDAYDAMETAFNLHLLATEKPSWTELTADQAAAKIQDLTDRVQRGLPTQTTRDGQSDEFQQFSTPPAHSFAANWVAKISQTDAMTEPSAGTGDLAIWSHIAGATVVLNELSERRRELLTSLFPTAQVFGENAEQLDNVLPRSVKPTVIVMNPPFSATAGRVHGERDTKIGAQHVEQALRRLENGGRLVAIVGSGMAADRPAFRDWWAKIAKQYNVKANIGIDGKEYAKYGTTFNNNILVIDKTGPTTKAVVTGFVNSVTELPHLLEGIRNERLSNESPQPELTGQADLGKQPDPVQPDTGAGRSDAHERSTGTQPAGDTQPTRTPATDREVSEQPTARDAVDDGIRTGDGISPGVITDAGRSSSGDSGGSPVSDTSKADSIAIESGPTEQAAFTESVFSNYTPQRLNIAGAAQHPGKLVQSAAMAAVLPPAPTYAPTLKPDVITSGKLSIAQLESLVYAGQAHSEKLPNGSRKGFFIGDGKGVGKGREISGIILDNLMQGREKAVWISFNEGLMNDAKRDFAGVGGNPDLIFGQGKTKAADTINADKGILFTTYSTLRSGEKKQITEGGEKGGKTRAQQIVDWLGKDFDGVIAFDEAHSMGNSIAVKGKRGTRKASQQAIAGINLQKELPNARVVYVSATGATEVSNLGYADRLGLWGEGTPFPDVATFIDKVSSGGIAAMELISRDMKALGMYLARSLSYDGVTYERMEHTLSEFQEDVYNELAGAWQLVLNNVEQALDLTDAGKNGNAKSAAMSQFWGAHQRFFNQVITALQTPAAIDHMREQIAQGHCVVVQLVNTNEAAQERIIADAVQNETQIEDLDFTPRQMLMDYVRNGFPVAVFEKVQDAEGRVSYVPAKDSNGNQIFDRQAIAMRDALLETLQQIRVPENPLDSILSAFGPDKVAEITGRGRRFVQTRDEHGDLKVIEEKRGKNSARADAEAFQGNKKDVLVFSGAGGTGYSFHADKTAANQRKRVHYILQPGWRADAAVQGFGRTHRTNQANEPHYVLPTTNLKAQKRFVSSIARRLDQLGALTRGQREATSQGMFSAADNLESQYASIGLQNFFKDLYAHRTPLNFQEITRAMGLDLMDETGSFSESKIPQIPQFLNRLLSLKTEQQNAVFAQFETRLIEAVEYAKQQGTFDEGLQTLRAKSIVKTRDEVAHQDAKSGAQTRYVELSITRDIDYIGWDEIHQMALRSAGQGGKNSGFYVREYGREKGQVFFMFDIGERIDHEGKSVHRGSIQSIRPDARRYIDNADVIAKGSDVRFTGTGSTRRSEVVTITRKVTPEEAKGLWEAQIAAAPATETTTESMLVGVILPIWDRVAGEERITRLQTDDGEQLLGRRMGMDSAKQTLKNLGLDSGVKNMTAPKLLEAINSGQRAILSNGWEIATSRVNGDMRIELKAGYRFSESEKRLLVEQGAFMERIQWQERLFIPQGETSRAIFARITASKPVVDLIAKGARTTDIAERLGDDLESGLPKSAFNSAAQARDPFFSGLTRGIEDLNTISAPPQGWKDALKGLVNKGIAKADEIEWTGLNDWLDLQQGRVQKADMLAYLDANGVRVTETTLSDDPNASGEAAYRAELAALSNEDLQEVADDFDLGFDEVTDSNRARMIDSIVNAHGDDMGGVVGRFEGEPRYKKYTLPGGQNYREILLTLPSKGLETRTQVFNEYKPRIDALAEQIDAATGSESARLATELRALQAERNAAADAAGGKVEEVLYKTSHWSQPNVLAHLRVNDRTDATGAKTLFVEEIQSDFGQDLKKQRAAISKAVDDDFEGIVKRMEKAGVLEVNCDK